MVNDRHMSHFEVEIRLRVPRQYWLLMVKMGWSSNWSLGIVTKTADDYGKARTSIGDHQKVRYALI